MKILLALFWAAAFFGATQASASVEGTDSPPILKEWHCTATCKEATTIGSGDSLKPDEHYYEVEYTSPPTAEQPDNLLEALRSECAGELISPRIFCTLTLR